MFRFKTFQNSKRTSVGPSHMLHHPVGCLPQTKAKIRTHNQINQKIKHYVINLHNTYVQLHSWSGVEKCWKDSRTVLSMRRRQSSQDKDHKNAAHSQVHRCASRSSVPGPCSWHQLPPTVDPAQQLHVGQTFWHWPAKKKRSFKSIYSSGPFYWVSIKKLTNSTNNSL